MESVLTFIADWLNSGVYEYWTKAWAWAIEKATIAYLSFLAWVIPFAWGIAKTIVTDLGISDAIAQGFSHLDSDVLNAVTFFKIPDAVNQIVTAWVTRFAMRFIPGL